MIKATEHFSFTVSNIEAALHFFCDLMGLHATPVMEVENKERSGLLLDRDLVVADDDAGALGHLLGPSVDSWRSTSQYPSQCGRPRLRRATDRSTRSGAVEGVAADDPGGRRESAGRPRSGTP